MTVLRQVVGDTLRALRMSQQRTLREVSNTARVSLGYLSEVERGQKEPSSELLAAICSALDLELSELFAEVTDTLRRDERLAATRATAGSAAAAGTSAGVSQLPAPRATARTAARPAPSGAAEPAKASVRSLPTVAA